MGRDHNNLFPPGPSAAAVEANLNFEEQLQHKPLFGDHDDDDDDDIHIEFDSDPQQQLYYPEGNHAMTAGSGAQEDTDEDGDENGEEEEGDEEQGMKSGKMKEERRSKKYDEEEVREQPSFFETYLAMA